MKPDNWKMRRTKKPNLESHSTPTRIPACISLATKCRKDLEIMLMLICRKIRQGKIQSIQLLLQLIMYCLLFQNPTQSIGYWKEFQEQAVKPWTCILNMWVRKTAPKLPKLHWPTAKRSCDIVVIKTHCSSGLCQSIAGIRFEKKLQDGVCTPLHRRIAMCLCGIRQHSTASATAVLLPSSQAISG